MGKYILNRWYRLGLTKQILALALLVAGIGMGGLGILDLHARCNSKSGVIFDIASVTASASPTVVCVGGAVSLTCTATTTPSGNEGELSCNWQSPEGAASGFSASTTFTTPGEKTITATVTGPPLSEETCEMTSSSMIVKVVAVSTVNHGKYNCWEGDQVEFTAVATPSGSTFPSGNPTWTATAGTFPNGNTGPSDVWQAPRGSGGIATITAKCGSSTASDSIMYVYMTASQAKTELLRAETDSFPVNLEPAGAPVLVTVSSDNPGVLYVNCPALYVTVKNGIENMYAWTANNIGMHVTGALGGCSDKVVDISYGLIKLWKNVCWDAYDAITYENTYNLTIPSLAEYAVHEAVYDQLSTAGMSANLSEQAAHFEGALAKKRTHDANPFPGVAAEGIVREADTWDGRLTINVDFSMASVQLYPPRWPTSLTPSTDKWKAFMNDMEIGGDYTADVIGTAPTLYVSQHGANWSCQFGLTVNLVDHYPGGPLGSQNGYGTLTLGFTYYQTLP